MCVHAAPGSDDEIVPASHSKRLHKLASLSKGCRTPCLFSVRWGVWTAEALISWTWNCGCVCVRVCACVCVCLSVDCADAQLYTVRGGTHNDSWEIGGRAYFERIRSFIEALF